MALTMEVLSFRKMMMIIVMIMMIGNMAQSELHHVGGNKISWSPKVNLSEWSSHENFHVDDWLYFGYDRYMYNVLEVNETSYKNCMETNFIKNVTGGAGRDVFHLQEAKTYYFLSRGGFCLKGMKVAINVTENIAATQPPVPPKNNASDARGIQSLCHGRLN
ncbi:early nodulin-like protein 20 [Gastrolobium bilobum]|uniref:early nodulin-like protein 20 n=1 Tax=Gastrolobium bilobum TaxID=150636 RepID=UPI002AAF1AE3|nr:early nodulin-like protein 20 [Gastrolobium bilobum]